MRMQSSFIGWDFDEIWSYKNGVNDGYPILQVFDYEKPIVINSGDINGDEKITIADIIRLARYIAEIDKTPLGKK